MGETPTSQQLQEGATSRGSRQPRATMRANPVVRAFKARRAERGAPRVRSEAPVHQEPCPTPTLDTAHRHTRTQTHMHTQHVHSLSDDLAPHCRSTWGTGMHVHGSSCPHISTHSLPCSATVPGRPPPARQEAELGQRGSASLSSMSP